MNSNIPHLLSRVSLGVFLLALTGCNLIRQEAARNNARTALPKVIANQSRVNSSDEYDSIAEKANVLLREGKYAELELTIETAYRERTRLAGGPWVLSAIFTGGLSSPNPTTEAAESEWKQHIGRLRDWREKSRDSVFPHVALAQCLVKFGFEARGSSVASKLSDEQVRLLQERAEDALVAIKTAKKIDPKFPQTYDVEMDIALAQGWSREKTFAAFEAGFNAEPGFYQLTASMCHYLLPEWYGNPGETAKFLKETSSRVDGKEGEILYFSVVAALQPVLQRRGFREVMFDWKIANSGYRSLVETYGTTRNRKNIYAYYAMGNAEPADKRTAIEAVGDDWDQEVWGSHQAFLNAKSLMTYVPKTDIPKPVREQISANPSQPTQP